MKRLASPFFCSGDKSAEERGAVGGGGGVEEEEEEEEEEQGRSGCGKKRRLRTEQVRALERCFEAENKLDPERKARLAHELGLQPRQVAVWFQNRRARWKTKQLERDFAALKSRYDALRLDLDSLRKDNQSLMAELTDLKSRLEPSSLPPAGDAALKKEEEKAVDRLPLPTTLADGPSDSDSSVVMAADESRLEGGIAFQAQQMFRMEEHDFLGGQELCSPAFFSDDHTPALPWFFCADIAGGW